MHVVYNDAAVLGFLRPYARVGWGIKAVYTYVGRNGQQRAHTHNRLVQSTKM